MLALGLRLEVWILLVIAPAMLLPTPIRLLAGLLLVWPWVAARRLTGWWVPPTPLKVPISVIALMTVVSLAVTPDVRFSLDKVSGVALAVLTFAALVRRLSRPEDVRAAVALFAAAGAALAVIGLLGTNWLEKFPAVAAVTRRIPKLIVGVRGAENGFQPNAVAGSLVLFVPLQFALLWQAARRPQPPGLPRHWSARATATGWTAILALTLATLALTQSRGAIGALLAAVIVRLTLGGRRQRLTAGAAALLIVIAGAVLGPRAVIDEINTPTGPGKGGLPERVLLWSHAVDAIRDAPFGVGMNMFRRMGPKAYPTFQRPPEQDIAHAHNQFLQTALDLGIPGLIAFVAICGLSAGVIRTIRRNDEFRPIAVALGTGILAQLIFGLTDAIPIGAKVGIAFWCAIALLAAMFRLVSGAPPGLIEQTPISSRAV